MPLPRIAPWFNREDYDAIKALCGDDPDLPDAFDEWLKGAAELLSKEESRGTIRYKVVVDPKEFSAWCRSAGVDANTFTLGAFAVKKSGEQREAGATVALVAD